MHVHLCMCACMREPLRGCMWPSMCVCMSVSVRVPMECYVLARPVTCCLYRMWWVESVFVRVRTRMSELALVRLGLSACCCARRPAFTHACVRRVGLGSRWRTRVMHANGLGWGGARRRTVVHVRLGVYRLVCLCMRVSVCLCA
jgi:hypothetical protein